MINRSFDIQQEHQKWKQIGQPFLQTAAQKSQYHDLDMIELCQNDEQLVFDNAAYMPSLEMLTKVLPVLDIQVWDVEPFTDGTNVVGWTLGFAPEIGCIGMNIEALMKKHFGKSIWIHPPFITSVQRYEEIWPIWKFGTFLKQFFEYAAETRNESMRKVVLVLPVRALTIDGKLSYSLDRRLILLTLRKYTQKVVITQGSACVQNERGVVGKPTTYVPDDASGMYMLVLLSTTPTWTAPHVAVIDFCNHESNLLPQAMQIENNIDVRLDVHRAKATSFDMLKLLNDLPCETRSSILEGETEEALIFKSTNLPTKVSFGLPQGWSAFEFFIGQENYELLTSQYDALARNGISYALVQESGALVVTHFPQGKEIPRMTADDVRVVLRKFQTFMDVFQQVVLWNKFDVLAIVDENCSYSKLAGGSWDLDHIVITEVATNKRIFLTKSVVSPPSTFLHHGVVISSDEGLNVARQFGAVKSSSTVKSGKTSITYEHMASAHLAAGRREFLPGKDLMRFPFGSKASDVYQGSEI